MESKTSGFIEKALFPVVSVSCFLMFVGAPAGCSAAESEGHTNDTQRYQLVVFDFERVELPFVICLWILIVALAKIAFHINPKLPTVVPESCLLIALGLIVGALLHYSHVATTNEYVLNADVFFIYLLPPIIFDAGYFMPVRAFFDNLGTILLLAFINTCISAGLIGISLYGLSYLELFGRPISILDCFIFSSLISAVDPVAVLSVFEEVHVNQMLYIIVFGESLLNDGVTVVLYHMMEGFIEIGEKEIIPIDVVTGISSFFIIAIGGTLIGVLFGFFGGFITKYTEHVKVIEPMFVFVFGYLMYLTAEMCHLSSILALSFGGIVLRHYLEANVSRSTRTSIKFFMKMLANISETIIFMFLGLSTMVDTLDWNFTFIFCSLLFCLIYRVLGVMILSWILNRRRLVKLTGIDQFIMAYGGLRGGIAFCLALSLDERLVKEKQLFVTATIVIVFFTVFVQGISIKPVVNALKVKKDQHIEPTMNEKIHEAFIDHLMAGFEGITQRSSHNLMRIKFRNFNHKYLKPLFNREKPNTKTKKVLEVFHAISVADALDQMDKKKDKLPLVQNEVRINGFRSPLGGVSNQGFVAEDDIRTPQPVETPDDADSDLSYSHKQGLPTNGTPPYTESANTDFIPVAYKCIDEPVVKETVVNERLRSRPPDGGGGEISNQDDGKMVTDKKEEPDTVDELDHVTITFKTEDNAPLDEEAAKIPDDTISESPLPWKSFSSQDPIPFSASMNCVNEEPLTAEAPTWVNNLAYNHLKESGSPYASPDVTFVPKQEEKHVSLFDIFDTDFKREMKENSGEQKKKERKDSCDMNVTIPPPWSCHNIEGQEELPVTSPSALEHFGDKNSILVSTHTSTPPTYHVILPTVHNTDGSISQEHSDEAESAKPLKTLPGSASAPDLPKHWQPFEPLSRSRMHSESVLETLDLYQEAVSRVQDWLQSQSAGDTPQDSIPLNDDEGIIIPFKDHTPELLSDNDADVSDLDGEDNDKFDDL